MNWWTALREGSESASHHRPHPVSISAVRRIVCQLLIVLLLAAWPARAADQKVLKVLPHLLDKDGRHTVSPSLFDRDAYQSWLKENPDQQTGIRYDIHWRSAVPGQFILKLELLGRVEKGQIKRRTIEGPVSNQRPRSRWSSLSLTGEEFKQFGPIVAWRVSLWHGDQLLAKHQSFLWE